MIPTGYQCRVECDSVSPTGKRLTTVVATYPRFVHAELLTHRWFSRSSASSRAIPVEKMIEAVERDPVMPVWWGKNQAGMQAREELTGEDRLKSELDWLSARNYAVDHARDLVRHGLHKQIVNRILEPFSWITTVITGTEWEGFFAQRCHPDAQPELKRIAEMIRDCMSVSEPRQLGYGQWHRPFLRDDDDYFGCAKWNHVSAARCARVSYVTHYGERDPGKDMELYEKLVGSAPGHWSPLEHVATPIDPDYLYKEGWDPEHASEHGQRNLIGWKTLRYEVER